MTCPRNTRSRSIERQGGTLMTASGVPSRSRGCLDEDGGHGRRVTRARPRMATPPTIRRSVSDASATPDGRVVDGEERRRHRHLPQHLGVVGEVVERAVAHEHLPDEQHHLGQEPEAEHDEGDGADLGEHVVGAGERTGEHERQHPLAGRSGHTTSGRGQRHEQQQRRRDADVLAVGDELEVGDLERVVPDGVADAHVDDGGHGGDGQQRPREHLLTPRAPQPERPAHRQPRQRPRRLAPAARGPV